MATLAWRTQLANTCLAAVVVLGLGQHASMVDAEDEKAQPAALPAPDGSFTHPDSSDWAPLLADDLSDSIYPKGVWEVADGLLTAHEDQNLWTKAVYDNFVVDLEFKNEEGTNSGVFVYASDIDNFVSNSVEVQILDDFAKRWANVPESWKCGAIFGRLPASRSVVRRPGEWNRMTIRCAGPHIDVVLNGHHVVSMDMRAWTEAGRNPDGTDSPPWLSNPLAELPTRGHIGFQGKHGGAPIWFRNIRIRKLPE